MLKKILLIGLFSVLLPLALFGAKNVKKEEVEEMTKADVIGKFTQINTEIIADFKKLDSINSIYWQNARLINRWLKYYRFIEVDTDIDRSWYEKAAKIMTKMNECKSFITSFIRKDEKDQSPEYQKALAGLKEGQKQFAELLKHPTPVDPKKLEKLRTEKYKSAK